MSIKTTQEYIKLTKEEKEIEKAIKEGKYESVDNLDKWKSILTLQLFRILDKSEKTSRK